MIPAAFWANSWRVDPPVQMMAQPASERTAEQQVARKSATWRSPPGISTALAGITRASGAQHPFHASTVQSRSQAEMHDTWRGVAMLKLLQQRTQTTPCMRCVDRPRDPSDKGRRGGALPRSRSVPAH